MNVHTLQYRTVPIISLIGKTKNFVHTRRHTHCTTPSSISCYHNQKVNFTSTQINLDLLNLPVEGLDLPVRSSTKFIQTSIYIMSNQDLSTSLRNEGLVGDEELVIEEEIGVEVGIDDHKNQIECFGDTSFNEYMKCIEAYTKSGSLIKTLSDKITTQEEADKKFLAMYSPYWYVAFCRSNPVDSNRVAIEYALTEKRKTIPMEQM